MHQEHRTAELVLFFLLGVSLTAVSALFYEKLGWWLLVGATAVFFGAIASRRTRTTTAALKAAESSTETAEASSDARAITARSSTMTYPFSGASLLARTIIMMLSAVASAAVGYYIYRLIWVGVFPDLGLQVSWKGTAKPVHPGAYPLLLMFIWLHFERAAAHANPGRGWLWGLDFLPSAMLLAFFVLTIFKLIVGEVAFADPTHLWIFIALAGSAASVAYYNFRHWFPAAEAARQNEDVAQGAASIHVEKIEVQSGATVVVAGDDQGVILRRFQGEQGGPRLVREAS